MHQGKGVTAAAAKASAVMEAIETFHAETLTLPLRLASYEEMRRVGPAVDPLTCRAPGRMRRSTSGCCGPRESIW